MNATNTSRFVFIAIVFIALAAYAMVGGKFGIDLVNKIMIFAIFALSLELLVGGTGLVCFGHAAFFGIGAYAAVLLSTPNESASLHYDSGSTPKARSLASSRSARSFSFSARAFCSFACCSKVGWSA